MGVLAAPEPIRPTIAQDCSSCRQRVPGGHRAWRAQRLERDGITSLLLCLRCARHLVRGTAGASAHRKAADLAGPTLAEVNAVDLGPVTVLEPPTARWRQATKVSALATAAAVLVTPVLGSALAQMTMMSLLVCLGGLAVASVSGTPARSTLPRPVATRGSAAGAWAAGARGERVVGDALERTGLPVLHDRSVPGSKANIDHVVVGTDAIYVVDAKQYAGHLRVAGPALFVNGNDQGRLLAGMRWQVEHLRKVLREENLRVPVRPVLCFSGSARPWRTTSVAGITVADPSGLQALLTDPGAPAATRALSVHERVRLSETERAQVCDLLAWHFPPT